MRQASIVEDRQNRWGR